MNCPKCGSENTQKFSIIYEHGAHDVSSSSSTSVTPTFSFFESARATTTTSGISLTKAAQKTAPPAKESYPIKGLLAGIAIILFLGAIGPWVIYTGLIIVGLCAYFAYNAFIYNKNIWPQRLGIWQKSWMCNKCGNIYQE
jgi:hypothetical protein